MGHPRSGVKKPRCAARASGDLIPGFICLSIVNLGNVGSNLNTILETKWSVGKTPIMSSSLILDTNGSRHYTNGAHWIADGSVICASRHTVTKGFLIIG